LYPSDLIISESTVVGVSLLGDEKYNCFITENFVQIQLSPQSKEKLLVNNI